MGLTLFENQKLLRFKGINKIIFINRMKSSKPILCCSLAAILSQDSLNVYTKISMTTYIAKL
jgi:hypothetical protein